MADTPDEASAFVDVYGWTWPSISDPARELARRLGADYQPHFILIDAEGRIVYAWEGGGDAQVWESMTAELP